MVRLVEFHVFVSLRETFLICLLPESTTRKYNPDGCILIPFGTLNLFMCDTDKEPQTPATVSTCEYESSKMFLSLPGGLVIFLTQ